MILPMSALPHKLIVQQTSALNSCTSQVHLPKVPCIQRCSFVSVYLSHSRNHFNHWWQTHVSCSHSTFASDLEQCLCHLHLYHQHTSILHHIALASQVSCVSPNCKQRIVCIWPWILHCIMCIPFPTLERYCVCFAGVRISLPSSGFFITVPGAAEVLNFFMLPMSNSSL